MNQPPHSWPARYSLSHDHTPGIRRGVARHALDPAAASRLWQLSQDLLAARCSRAPCTAPEASRDSAACPVCASRTLEADL
ncbi:hypothetical protein GA0115240_16252 [Streptomyces sp. DvalAA-14]|uniref:hypothetical protein n=1 Tax=unclassified Streptomyces TaxID=2593676 RepID=UPI00081B8409|nr:MULTISPECIES: hypothetical protein [unclassified Streptomyces]MYS24268.1 hypothetical protein [Streptomyces sp. SID4948]SCE44483.1 hypothetical protein GA0115240_16252 [Streptomyces sp. DvalAA-14]